MKPNQYRNEYRETSLCLAIYRAVWLAVFVIAVISACAWADKDMRGKSPETIKREEAQP